MQPNNITYRWLVGPCSLYSHDYYWRYYYQYDDWGEVARALIEQDREQKRLKKEAQIQTAERFVIGSKQILILVTIPVLGLLTTVWPGFFTHSTKLSLFDVGNPMVLMIWTMFLLEVVSIFHAIHCRITLARLKREQ